MKNPEKRLSHQPVLYHNIINILQPKNSGRYVDGTVGAGGHSAGILEASRPGGMLIGLDIDKQALAIAEEKLSIYGDRVIIRKGSYADLSTHIKSEGWECTDGILMDLGVSSMQLDTAERGFSFNKEARLDMRFDQQGETDAWNLINELSEAELAKIIWIYGEEPRSRQIAKALVKNRPLISTQDLASLIETIYGKKRGGIHPATRTFQALRIAVNKELDVLEKGLVESLKALCSGGRLAVISFHSLEDRIVKQFFQQESRDCICPPEQPVCICGHIASLKILTKRPIRPSEEEAEKNPRARSAKLRAAEKI